MSFNMYSPAGQRVLAAWLFFHITAHVLLPLLLLTFLLTRVKRHPIFVNMLLSLVLASVLYVMLWYRHHEFYSPSFEAQDVAVHFDRVCLIQASVAHHAIPPMISLSAFALTFHVWTRVGATAKPDSPQVATFTTLRTTVLLLAPWLAFALFALASSFVISNNIQAEPPVVVLELFCKLRHDALGKVRAVFTTIVLLTTAIYEVRIILALRRRSTDMDHVDRALFFRVLFFGAYVLLAFVLSVVSIATNTAATSSLYVSSVPVAFFFTFACQKDVLLAWTFWKPVNNLPVGHTRRPSLTPLWPKESV